MNTGLGGHVVVFINRFTFGGLSCKLAISVQYYDTIKIFNFDFSLKKQTNNKQPKKKLHVRVTIV